MKKILGLFLVVILAVSIAACGNGTAVNSTQETQSSQNATQQPTADAFAEKVEISMLITGALNDGDSVLNLLKEKFNADFSVVSAAWGDLHSTLNLKVASGDVPDIFIDNEPMSVSTLSQDGVALSMSDYLDGFPNLKQYYDSRPDISQLYAYDGKLYVFPMSFGNEYHGILMRADWLKQLGLGMPKTYDELRNVLKAFVEKNPGGNVATGLTLSSVAFLDDIYPAFTGFNSTAAITSGAFSMSRAVMLNGKMTHMTSVPGFREAVEYIESLYKDGLLDKELGTLKDSDAYAKYINGMAGACFLQCNKANWELLYTPAKEKAPDSDSQLLVPFPAGPVGQYWKKGNEYLMFEYLNANLAKDDVKRNRILSIFDFVNTDEGKDLSIYGIDGVDSKVENGQHVFLDNDTVKNDRVGNRFSAIFFAGNFGNRTLVNPQPLIDNANAVAKYGLMDKFIFNAPSEEVDNVTRLTTNVNGAYSEWMMKFYVNEKDASSDTEWNKFLDELNKAGLSELMQLYEKYGKFVE